MNFKFRKFLSLAFILFLCTQGDVFASRVFFTSTEELPALRMKYSDLETVLNKASALANEANSEFVRSTNFEDVLKRKFDANILAKQDSKFLEEQRQHVFERYPKEEIVFTSGGDKQSLTPYNFSKLESLPDETYALNYDYSYDSDVYPITSITITFGDYRREIEIRGFSAQHVEAIKNTLRADFLKHSTVIGGAKFRYFAGLIALLVGLILVNIALSMLSGKKTLGWILLVCCGLFFYGLLSLPFDSWLPGFAIYREDPSFLVHYAPEIGFIGVLLGAIGIAIPFLPGSRSEQEEPAAKKRTPKKK